MVKFSHDDIPTELPVGDYGYSFAKDIVRQARNAVCNIYRENPGLPSVGVIPGSPADAWKRGFWDDICRRAPGGSAPPPQKPVNGGQCPVLYDITVTSIYKNREGQTVDTRTQTTTVLGAIRSLGIATINGARGVYAIGGNGDPRGLSFTFDPVQSSIQVASFTVDNIVRQDGLPDNCGDPPISYPPPSTQPPGGVYITPYVPPTPTSPGNGFNITVPFVFLRPQFDFAVDVGGVTVNFDLGGIEINIDNRFGDGSPGSIGQPAPQQKDYSPEIEAARQAAESAKQAAEDAQEAANNARKKVEDRNSNDPADPQNDPNKQEKTPKGENDPKEEDAINRLLAVQVELLSMPVNRRTQDGGDAPDVNYAGWFEFKTKGSPHPRVPIHFERNYFIAPAGADGYAYTLYNGFRGRAIVVTAKATQ